MPDITMCQNKKCKKKMECYRYIALPDKLYQSYFMPNENDCKNFVQATKSDKERSKNGRKN
jgi:hypothetical protein